MFKKLLIANRGEIAVRIIRACQELGIKTVAIYSSVDQEALHAELADEAVDIGEPRAYLNKELIVQIAKEKGAEALHPGYGFLSENSEFARLCTEAGVTFVGPPPTAIESMGDKAVARETMMKAGVPVVPGSDALVDNVEQAHEIAMEIGYPVLIKASAGGGGRGMRIAMHKGELEKALEGAKSEAQSCFGNSEVYIEKYLENCRHIEFQVLADNYGNVIHLGERDCSVQRRNQKLIEESPSPALHGRLREVMGEVAVTAARAVNYSGAGTVEFLLSQYGDFYFMEMNTRIQVEHPVTEEVTGIDLIKEQIKVAAGERLNIEQKDVVIRGHAIEARINAENPFKNFMPNPGQITYYRPPGGFGVRLDSAVYPGYTINPYYDSMIGKLVVYGKDRQEALKRLERCLEEFIIEGVETTIPFHLHVLKNEYFKRGEVYTNFILKRLEPFGEEQRVEKPKKERPIVYKKQPAKQSEAKQEITSEIMAVITAAVESIGQDTKYMIKEVAASRNSEGLGPSPWKAMGLNQLMMGRVGRGR